MSENNKLTLGIVEENYQNLTVKVQCTNRLAYDLLLTLIKISDDVVRLFLDFQGELKRRQGIS